METEKQRIEELVKQLNAASAAYYNGQDEIMPNYEWDALFDELTTLEEKTGYIIKDSPTQNAGYEESGSGQKEPHEYPALSLAKTKQVEELQQWAGAYPIWLSWKLDGLTLVLTYDNGNLVKILTRGNGNLGTNITFLKGAIGGFPQKISYQGHLVVRGEAAISYTDFAQINDMIEDDDEKYANPRNLASGTLDLEDPAEVKARHVRFHAFTLVHLDEAMSSWGERMDYLEKLGFTTVAHECKHIEQYASYLTEESLHSRYYMACAAYVCSFNVDYYMSNYHNIMTEMDAELFSIVFARKYFGQLWGKKLSDIEILRMINSHCGKRGHDGWFFPKLYENVSSVDLFLKHFEKYAIEMCFDTRRVYHISRSSDPAAKYLRKHSELLYAWNMCQSGVAQDVLLAKITANLNGAGQQRMYFPYLYDKFHNHLTIETSRSEDLVNRTNKIFEMAKKYGY